MSLIHDALKKAEMESKPDQGKTPAPFNPILPEKKSPQGPRIILGAFLVLSLAFLVYMRVFKKPASEPIPQPIAAVPAPIQIQIQTQNPVQLKEEALKFYEENKWEDSLQIWERLTLLLPTDAEIYNNLGMVRKKLGRKKEAYEAYNQALALNKDYPEGLNNLAVLYLSDGDPAKAKDYLERAVALKKEYADPYFNLALILEQEGNFKGASQSYRQFLDLSPSLGEELKKKIQDKLTLLEKQ